ncbi:MAG: type VI secretion system Vgr family protein [Telluria sp.]
MLEEIATLLARYTQATRLIRLTTPLGAEELLAECVRGEEAISEGFTFTISALSEDAGVSLRALLGQPALLELLTVDSGQVRPFHGHLTAVELNGANGGLARYTLTLQPWSTFLARGRDSRVFQDLSVPDILDAVFSTWQGRGKLAPAWRFDVADRSLYPVRSLVTQYQESDLAFAERLMSEEGLFYYFEHEGNARSPGLGRHEMVIADHNGAFKRNVQASVRYTQPGAVMKEDSMDRWRCELRLQTNVIELQSWDYRTLDSRPVSSIGAQGTGAELVSRDVPGQYAYSTRTHGQFIADRQMQALEARREVFTGAGTVRTLSPGTTFSLSGHAVHDMADSDDARSFVITRVLHLMHNNLTADLQSQIVKRVGEACVAGAIAAEQGASPHAIGSGKGERPLYRNRIDAIRASVPYRASRSDGHCRLLHPRPTIRGQQTAVVVGPGGAVVHTDRDHRVKVQFHWQRGAGNQLSHSRLSHPTPDGHTGAPGDDRAGTWVRVATPLAGANWGSNAVPRVGQEVLVDFMDGNIDRPVIVGALYNGAGKPDAQHNEVSQGAGVATGNAPAWFPGEANAHAHPAVLSGLKSQEMQASQGGVGAYSQLVFDDSPGQARVALQRHASAHKGTDELNLGHLRHQSDNQRLHAVGFGAELKTEHSAALRAGQGMLLSADRRNGASGSQMDSREAHSQISTSQELQQALATTAQKHNAKLQREAGPAELPAIAQMTHSAKVIAATGAGGGRQGAEGGQGEVASFGEAHVQLSSPAGIIAATPANALFVGGDTTGMSVGHDINFVAQENSFHTVYDGISLFTYGKANSKEKPNQEAGIKLHAASGKLWSQSQSAETKITADKAVTVASVTKSVMVGAKEHVLLTAQGAYLKLKGGNIELHGPGKVEFKASMKELAGPKDSSAGTRAVPKAKGIYNEAFVVLDEQTGEPMPNVPYRLESAGGAVIEGITDAQGRVERVFTAKPEELKLFLTDED